MPDGAVEFKDQFNLEVALNPFQDFGLHVGAVFSGGARFGPKLDAGKLNALRIEQVIERDVQRLGERQKDPELGVSSPRSYFPIAWAVTLSSIALDSSRKENPALRLASLIRSAITATLVRFTVAHF